MVAEYFMKALVLALVPFILCGLLFAQGPRFQFTHKGSVLHIKFSPTGSKLISYSSGNQDLALWDVSTGNLLWKRPISFIQKADEYYTLQAFAWSPDEKLIATGSANGTVQLWNSSDGAFVWRAEVSKEGVSAITFSPDARTVATTEYSGNGAAATLIDVRSGTSVKILRGNKCGAIGIAFDSSGNELSIGNLNGNVVRWDLATGKSINPADCKGSYAYGGERSYSEDLTLSVRRTTADQIVIEDFSGKVLKPLTLNDSKMRSVINAKANNAVIREYGGYRLYDLASGAEKKLSDCVSGSAFDLSADGRYFAQSCDGFKTSIRVTDLNSDRSWLIDGHPSKINAVVYSPDFSVLAVAGNDGNAYLFDPATRSLKKRLVGNGSRLTTLAFTSDGKRLDTGDENSVLHRWDLSTGSILDEAKVTDDRSDDIDKIETSIDGKNTLVLINSAVFLLDNELRVRGTLQTPDGYSSTSGNVTSTYSSMPINSAAFSFDGGQVITAHPDGTLRFWDVSKIEQVKKVKVADSVKFVASVDRTSVLALAMVGTKARFHLIDSVTGKSIRQSVGIEPSYLEKMSLSPNKRIAAITGNIGDTVICDLDTMMLRTLDYGLSGEDSVAFSRDAKTFFIGGENQNLSLYDAASLKRQWTLLPEFVPSAAEIRLAEEKDLRVAEVVKNKKIRNREATAYVRANRNKVYITLEHYGEMSDPGEKRMIERSELNQSKSKKSSAESNAIWLRLHNDSSLPIEVPTESMYLSDPKCFHQFPNGEKLSGLCRDREIGIWFGVKDRQNKWVPYGFDFGSSVILLPHSSVLFPVPLSVWNKSYSVVFDYSFQNIRASENDRDMDFGSKVEMRVSKSSSRKP
jgi:WD40 repeat protein